MNSSSYRGYLASAAAGVASFLVGYLVTFLWVGRDVESSLEPIEAVLTLFEAEPIGAWRVVGWVFYGAHFVDTQIVAGIGPIETAVYVNPAAEGGFQALYLVPPLLLLLAGFAAAYLADVDELLDGVKYGAAVTAGYLVVVGIGIVAFAYGDTSPDPLFALVLAGIVYPAVFGSIGGAVATAVRGTD